MEKILHESEMLLTFRGKYIVEVIVPEQNNFEINQHVIVANNPATNWPNVIIASKYCPRPDFSMPRRGWTSGHRMKKVRQAKDRKRGFEMFFGSWIGMQSLFEKCALRRTIG